MDQPRELRLQPITQAQGTLFSLAMLPRQLRIYKSELEDEFLPPRDQRLNAKLPH